MRRKVGVSVVKRRQNEADQYGKLGKEMSDMKVSFVQDMLTSFRNSLSEFAAKHRDKINSDPEFRQQFHSMCLTAGVDPLASSKGFWSDMLGMGNFYFELGVKIVQISVSTRASNGGVMKVEELLQCIKANGSNIKSNDSKKKNEVSVADVLRAVEKLSALGNGFRIITLNGKQMIISVPLELNKDHESIMSAAEGENGCISEALASCFLGWSAERFKIVIMPMLLEGMVWVDRYKGKSLY